MAYKQGQDFLLPFASLNVTSHNITDIEPRIPLALGRLMVAATTSQFMLTGLSIGGHEYHLGDGFPGVAFFIGPVGNIASMTKLSNHLAAFAAPTTPMEVNFTSTAAADIHGYIGTSSLEPEEAKEVQRMIADGEILGEPNFTWGLGEHLQPTADTAAEEIVIEKTIPRSATLRRMVVHGFADDGSPITTDDIVLKEFKIRGDPMLSLSNNLSVSLLSAASDDDMGLMVNRRIEPQDKVRLVFEVVNAQGVGVKAGVQVGFFID